MFFLQISRFLDSNSQLRIHKMMTDCLHYKDYARDAIILVVQKLEGGVVDGKRGGEGPPVEMWPGAPSNLKTALKQMQNLQKLCPLFVFSMHGSLFCI